MQSCGLFRFSLIPALLLAFAASSLGQDAGQQNTNQQNPPVNQPQSQATQPQTPPASQPDRSPQQSTEPAATTQQPTTAQPNGTDAASPQATSPQTPDDAAPSGNDTGMFVFKKEIEEVVLHATVVDDRQRLAAHLDKTAFAVFEDGKQQSITSFHREDVPVAIGVVIDNSGSMRDKRDQVNQAVLNLIRISNPQDQVFVVNFSQNSYLDQDFTSDINLLEQALHRTTMQGSTALYDAVVAAAAHLQKSQLEKKILLVITDGRDNMSKDTLQEATRQLQQKNGPTVYAIGLMGPTSRNSGREALQSLADATGGSAFFPQNLDEVGDIARNLAHDIRSQYTIAYKPGNQGAKGTYHPVMVEARAAGYGKLTVRTKNGYYAGEAVR
jgi:Ca-activated chloride channel family protein